jgi:hypothetical protein
VIAYGVQYEPQQPLVLVMGDVANMAAPLVRLHSSCFTGDLLDSLRCDCGDQLHMALDMIGSEGAGVPKQAFWMLPVAGIALSLGVTVATGFFAVVHEHRTWTVVRKPTFGWSHSYASVEDLRAASAEHPDAAELLRRSGLDHPK